jgi:hypothetical protein
MRYCVWGCCPPYGTHGNEIPEERWALGYRNCVKCSEKEHNRKLKDLKEAFKNLENKHRGTIGRL